ncbi:NADH-dependent flavin oxidoreductase [Paenibacillus sp. FSL H8-0548]|uniref:NADH-dependent flavin oxidoreductase n=1 Tax=Paenibacillus sp. FSL H8-0548 TaxID=1920422 RepID=UPI0009701407|nr:NADH-dependent flavin oxidoreductase [Paenibacillus sp. FSL H8-0548]OMF37935.1 NADH-dependent flavin oxidoreductase [Paenibacillus sp. FSL H8-0548]
MNNNYKSIFEPFEFPSGVQLKNRVIMAPMTLGASKSNGAVTEEELAYYIERAQGVGAVITSSALVSQNGKLMENGFGVDDDVLLPGLKTLANTIHEQGSKAFVQIFHGGRSSNPALLSGGQPLSASTVAAEPEGSATPKAMTEEEIEDAIEEFANATRRVIEAGFDGVEIHGANGFLIQQFFSPHSNRREDQWGGTLEKRMRFPLEIIKRVKEVVAKYAKSPFVVGYRFSPEERETPGITMEDTLQFVDVLALQNLDYVHLSVDHFWGEPRREESNSTTSRVVMVQERVGNLVPVIGVGGLSTPDDVVKALGTGIPLVAMGHALIMEPKWVEKVQSGQEKEIRTTLPRTAQKELVVLDVMWGMITNIPGWFPVVD